MSTGNQTSDCRHCIIFFIVPDVLVLNSLIKFLKLIYNAINTLFQNISGYFDLSTGSKTEKESYTKIAAEAGVDASSMLFLTDLPSGRY